MPDTANTVTGDYTVLAAHTAGAHGVSGSVRLRLVGGVASDENDECGARSLQVGRTVRLVRESDGLARDLTLAALRRQPKGVWIARFKEVTDRSGGEGLQGCAVMIREGERAALLEGEYYVDQLLGLPVVTDAGRALGALTDVLSTPAHDVYVTDDGAMIPVAGDYIVRVDLAEKQIVVRDVPGLHGGE